MEYLNLNAGISKWFVIGYFGFLSFSPWTCSFWRLILSRNPLPASIRLNCALVWKSNLVLHLYKVLGLKQNLYFHVKLTVNTSSKQQASSKQNTSCYAMNHTSFYTQWSLSWSAYTCDLHIYRRPSDARLACTISAESSHRHGQLHSVQTVWRVGEEGEGTGDNKNEEIKFTICFTISVHDYLRWYKTRRGNMIDALFFQHR